MKSEPIKKEDIINPEAIKALKEISKLCTDISDKVKELESKLSEFKV